MPYKYIPNFLSIMRIVLAPIFILVMFANTFYMKLLALMIFFIGSLSDFLDGYLARKFNYITEIGKFIDPLADKILIVSAFIMLNYFYSDIVESWMIIVIVSRDVFITCARYIFIKYYDATIKTSIFGKLKTLFQIIVVHIILLLHFYNSDLITDFKIYSFSFIYILMIACIIFTVSSGLHYLYVNFLNNSNDN